VAEVEDGWARLSRAVSARRGELKLSQAQIAGRGGPSHETLRAIEKAERTRYQAKTWGQLDFALGWRPGTAWSIVDGSAGDDPRAWVIPEEIPWGDTSLTEITGPPRKRAGYRRRVLVDGRVQESPLYPLEWVDVGTLPEMFMPLLAAREAAQAISDSQIETVREYIDIVIGEVADRV
jgi:hypothetical protein